MTALRSPEAWQKSLFAPRSLATTAAVPAHLPSALHGPDPAPDAARVAILKAHNYRDQLKQKLGEGLITLDFPRYLVAGKRVVLKPNLVEPSPDHEHINTHPLLIQAAVELFRSLGARSVVVAEGAGHVRDSWYVLEESGLLHPLAEDQTPFVDLNFDECAVVANRGSWTRLTHLVLPRTILHADLLVSLAKLKTHHWAGVSLAMKNLFGIMPGEYYGWPKTVLHEQKVPASILDINATVRPHLAIVDGIVGMEGDGPIMGSPVAANVLVMGTNLPAVDATCVRIMGADPWGVAYLRPAAHVLGPIDEAQIDQRGEPIAAVRRDFAFLDFIPSHQPLRTS